MADLNELTLSQIQEKLGVAQHVLIHLCEKGVIEPDFAETEGRGVWRRFSQRNLFEFAVALALRTYQIPVASVATIISNLRTFEEKAPKTIKGFSMPESLLDFDFEMSFYDGKYLFFKVSKPAADKPVLLLSGILGAKKSWKNILKPVPNLPKTFEAQLTLRLSDIAKRLAAT